MKFFLSQTEMNKEDTRVGTLTLIRAVVSADGEQGRGRGVRGGGSHPCLDLCHFLFCRHYWVGQGAQVSAASRFLSLDLTSTMAHSPHSQPSP